MSRYRSGGGLRGNVLPNTLTVLKAGPPGIASVTNPAGARGGVDPEGLDNVRVRGAMELRSRHRAVTAEDFEYLAGEASPRVARAVCVPPDEAMRSPCASCLTFSADRRLESTSGSRRAAARVGRNALDERRLLALLCLSPVRLRVVERRRRASDRARAIRAHPRADAARAHRFLNPLVGEPLLPRIGREFGRTLTRAS